MREGQSSVWSLFSSSFSCFVVRLFDSCSEQAPGTDAAADRMITNEFGGARGIVRSV